MVTQFIGEERIEIRFHLVFWRLSPSSLNVISDSVLVLSHAQCHALQRLNRVGPDLAHLVAQLLQADPAPIVDEPDDAPPGIYTGQPMGLFEHDLGLARNAVRQEAPDRAVENLDVVDHIAVAITDLEAPADGLMEPLRRDPGLFALGPIEDLVDRRYPGNEVVFHLTFPGIAPFEPLEPELLLRRDPVVEDPVGRQRTKRAEA